MKKWNITTPLRTALIYAVFSALWTSFSDDFLESLVPTSSPNYFWMQTLNDWLFVFASAALIYFMLRSELKSLGASEEKFKYIFDNSVVGKTISSPEGVVTANKAFREMLGYSEEELVGEKWQEITHPDDIELSSRAIKMLLNGEKDTARLTKRNIHKNGSVVWVDLNTSLRRNEEGEPMYFMTSVLDITERKLAEERIQDLLEFNEKILKTAPIGIFTYKLSGECVFANENAALITGTTVEKLEAQNFHAIESWKTSGLYQLVERAIAGKVSVTSDIYLLSTFGKEVWLTVRAITFRSKHEDQLLLTISDITERKEAELELQESEGRYRSLFENMTSGYAYCQMIFDQGEPQDFIYINVNPTFEALTGLKEVDGKKVSDVIPGIRASNPELFETYGRVALTGIPERLETYVEALATWFFISVYSPKEGYFVAVFDNITERKHAEGALKERERKLQTILEILPVGVSVLDAELKLSFVNPTLQKMLGLMQEDALGTAYTKRKYINAAGAPMQEDEFASMRALKENKAIYDVETGVVDEEGCVVWTNMSAVPVDFQDWKVVITTTDITERKQARERLQASERTLKLFVEHAPASIAMFDRDMKYIAVSRRFLADYHLPDQSLIGRSHYEVFPEVPEHWKQIHKRCLAGAIEKAEEDAFPRADGSMDWVRWEIHPWYEPSGAVGGILLFSEVITQRKQTLEVIRQYANQLERKVSERTLELNQMNIELEHANRAKDEFLANMSHELRTPLNSILGLSESLLEQHSGLLNSSQEKFLQIISSSGSHLLNLINDILDLSKIEAGKFDYYPQAVSVDELCKASLSFVKSQAYQKSIAVHYNNEASVSTIIADPRRLKQILVNLLTNAVKFTSENGQVTLEVHADPEKENIQFSVIDTGMGIAPEDLERLFTPFVQVDSSITRQFEGTGLGLSLVQKLTDLHGGGVHVESEVGKGSRFTINLPCNQKVPKPFEEVHIGSPLPVNAPSETIERLPKAKGTAAPYRILLAEDNQANILTVGEYLESYGYEILVAHDGLEAIAMVQANLPDIILMDIQMPVMGGLEAIQRLRADPRFTSTPIIALTALAMVGDRERCLEAGATEYMSKPVSLKALRGMIEKFLADIEITLHLS